MLTGDSTTSIEKTLIDSDMLQLQSDILLLGHHGSDTSTSEKWVEAVNPDIAIYQASINNSYGHPHQDVLGRLDRYGIPVYGTDKDGTIRVIFDEKGEIDVFTEGE